MKNRSLNPLPKIRYINKSGFTLVELLVVIAIIAVLTVVGFTIFSGVQSKARDSKRVQDIIAMANAMEVNYRTGTGYTTALSTAWFNDLVIPSNIGPGGTPYATAYNLSTTTFTFCAQLENSTGNALNTTGPTSTSTGIYFCRRNLQ